MQDLRRRPIGFPVGLEEAYAHVGDVNKGIVKRIRSVGKGDADANAVIILHSLVSMMAHSSADDLGDLNALFR